MTLQGQPPIFDLSNKQYIFSVQLSVMNDIPYFANI